MQRALYNTAQWSPEGFGRWDIFYWSSSANQHIGKKMKQRLWDGSPHLKCILGCSHLYWGSTRIITLFIYSSHPHQFWNSIAGKSSLVLALTYNKLLFCYRMRKRLKKNLSTSQSTTPPSSHPSFSCSLEESSTVRKTNKNTPYSCGTDDQVTV